MAMAGCLDQSTDLMDTEQASDSAARDRFFSLNTAGNVWSRVETGAMTQTYAPFEGLDGTGMTKLAAERNQDGRINVFAIGPNPDRALFTKYQTAPGGGWNTNGWQALGGGWIKQLATVQNQDGRIEVFCLNDSGEAFHQYQTTPNGNWSGWQPFSGLGLRSISAAKRSDGRLEVAAVTDGGQMYHRVQYAPGSGWDADWSYAGGYNLASVQLAVGHAGLVAIGIDQSTSGANVHELHEDASFHWSAMSGTLGGSLFRISSFSIGTFHDARLSIVGIKQGGIVELPQATSTYAWPTDYHSSFDASPFYAQVATARNAANDFVIYARGNDGVMYWFTPAISYFGWDGVLWTLGGAYQTDVVGIDQQ
ncbi:MAG: hypothetical protein QM831_35115 [Kofleriaceae bacterium]